MIQSKTHNRFEVTRNLLNEVNLAIDSNKDLELSNMLNKFHFADIAELISRIDLHHAIYIIKLLESEKTSQVLSEIDIELSSKILESLSIKEIASELDELDTDDAVDLISELPKLRQLEVIRSIHDPSHKNEIQELLAYDKNSAGGLMAKELVKVYETWTVSSCLRKIRNQAKNVKRVHSIYVVDKDEKLIGRLSLKDLISAENQDKISDIYIKKVNSVNVNESGVDVVKIMRKYDLEAIPVVDADEILIGRITIDDMVDFIKEEADKDYQLAAGIINKIRSEDSVWSLTKARLPWLFLGLIGGFVAFLIIENFKNIFFDFTIVFFFTPLIAAMSGNVGVQSSAIIVQGLANKDINGSIYSRLFKEMLLALINGLILSIFLFSFIFLKEQNFKIAFAVSTLLILVLIIASLIGTFIPIFLSKKGIDPAIATGPFITTSNDLIGVLIYFLITKSILAM